MCINIREKEEAVSLIQNSSLIGLSIIENFITYLNSLALIQYCSEKLKLLHLLMS